MHLNCLFCHGRAGSGVSREHLFSNPVCDFFGLDRKTTLAARVDGNTGEIRSVAPLGSTTVNLPCVVCNSGWMSDLENEVVHVFERWLHGNSRLTEDDLRTLRRWMAKTHLVLCTLEGGTRKFVEDPRGGVVPDATMARLLYEGSDDAFGGAHFAAGAPIHSKILYGFGNPRPICVGPTPISSRAATVSYMNLGPVQLWTLATMLSPISVRFPSRLTVLARRLAHRQLRTVDGNPDPVSATIDYGDLDLDVLLDMVEHNLRGAGG